MSLVVNPTDIDPSDCSGSISPVTSVISVVVVAAAAVAAAAVAAAAIVVLVGSSSLDVFFCYL